MGEGPWTYYNLQSKQIGKKFPLLWEIFLFNFFLFHGYVCLDLCATWVQYLRRLEEDITLSRARGSGGCELPNRGAGNQTLVLYNSSKCFSSGRNPALKE